ncbi:MAG: type II secretion system F family protein [Chloroflexi bacterium]|nr:type II secretion system F family protein [Chloroflexota bacterium]
METAAVVSVLVFLMVAQAVWLAAPAPQSAGAERVTSYITPMWEPSSIDGRTSVMRQRRDGRFPWLDALLERFNLTAGLTDQLLRAGVPLRPGEFIVVQVGLGIALALVAVLALSPIIGSLFAASAGMVIGYVGPLGWLRYKRGKRLDDFDAGLPDALDLVAGALRAGFGLPHGLDLVAKSNRGPCAEEFGQVLQEVNLGADLDVSLSRVTQRVDSEDARLLATAVAVQRRTGGNLVEVLGQLAAVIRERQRLRRDVRVITTAPRVSGYVIALLPLVTLLVMYLSSRYYVDVLFSSFYGRIATGVGGLLVLLGLYLNTRIADVDF